VDEDREPNAIRMQSVFTQRPQYASRIIWEQVRRGYYRHLSNKQRIYYEKLVGQIMEQLSEYEGEANKPLEDTYLLGYYLQKNEMYPSKNKEQKD
jgi:CRISPR-associated protein Csd1